MGVLDEHWCSKCKKVLDKKTDHYVEINLINQDKKKAKKEGLHTRVMLCQECLEKEKETSKLVEKLRKHANPNFLCQIYCQSTAECPDFKPRNDKVNCEHIYVIDDKVYCGRRHPGATKLNQDKVMVDQKKSKDYLRFNKKMLSGFSKSCGFSGSSPIAGLLKSAGFESEISEEVFKVPDEEIITEKNLVKPKN